MSYELWAWPENGPCVRRGKLMATVSEVATVETIRKVLRDWMQCRITVRRVRR